MEDDIDSPTLTPIHPQYPCPTHNAKGEKATLTGNELNPLNIMIM